MQGRDHLVTSLLGLGAGVLLAVIGVTFEAVAGIGVFGWFPAHAAVLTFGFLLPALYFLHVHIALAYLPRPVELAQTDQVASMTLSGALLLGIGLLLQPSGLLAFLAFGGMLMILVAATVQAVAMVKALPRRGESVVDTERDPLTKGDDACLKHIKLAHIFLPLGLALLAAASFPGVAVSTWGARLGLAGSHVLLIGYGLLSIYGLGHLVVPRLSGVPAIAAGAIKGELHSTMTGLLVLVLAFLFSWPDPVLVLGGAFVFVGFFTYMGVLGANIMKRKSKTHRVTREFVYVPWTFAGVFWLISGVLMGMFLAAVPDALAPYAASLRFLHVHINLFGGMALLWLGWNYRLLATWTAQPPPTFEATKWPFYLLNGAVVLLAVGHLQDGVGGSLFVAGTAAALLGFLWYGWSLKGYFPAKVPGGAP